MNVALVYDSALEAYEFPPGHPMRPERFSLAVSLMRAWGLLVEQGTLAQGDTAAAVGHARAEVWTPQPAAIDELLLVHDRDYVEAVIQASRSAGAFTAPGYGLGPGDTPAFPGMHDAAALAVGASIEAVDGVLSGRASRTFNPAGGMHHAHARSASGFCVYDDAAIAIEAATRRNDGVRVAYVDIDAHHGNGVEEAFVSRGDVLTVSVHESGRYLFPGTGFARDIGEGAGVGSAINVALPLYADDACYALVLDRVIGPALRAFGPDMVVLQGGADSHHGDPLTDLGLTIEGYLELVRGVAAAADAVCAGRVAMLGGGGYQPFSEVPRMWGAAMAVLLGVAVPDELPPAWLDEARTAASRQGERGPLSERTLDDSPPTLTETERADILNQTVREIDSVMASSPLLGGAR